MTYRLNDIHPDNPVCKESQIVQNQTLYSPSLLANAGDTVILLYQENGHVTKIDEDPGHPNAGTIRVFGAVNSFSADTLQDITRSVPLGEWSFDDGICYQDNGSEKATNRKLIRPSRPHLEVEGPDVWCTTSIKLPDHLSANDIYSLYWIWNFDGVGTNGLDFVERYTTCIDVVIT
jgi:hypothetical protein